MKWDAYSVNLIKALQSMKDNPSKMKSYWMNQFSADVEVAENGVGRMKDLTSQKMMERKLKEYSDVFDNKYLPIHKGIIKAIKYLDLIFKFNEKYKDKSGEEACYQFEQELDNICNGKSHQLYGFGQYIVYTECMFAQPQRCIRVYDYILQQSYVVTKIDVNDNIFYIYLKDNFGAIHDIQIDIHDGKIIKGIG